MQAVDDNSGERTNIVEVRPAAVAENAAPEAEPGADSVPAGAVVGYDFSIGKDFEGTSPAEGPVDTMVYQPPPDTPVDNHVERAFRQTGDEAADEEGGAHGMHYDPYPTDDVTELVDGGDSVPASSQPPVVFAKPSPPPPRKFAGGRMQREPAAANDAADGVHRGPFPFLATASAAGVPAPSSQTATSQAGSVEGQPQRRARTTSRGRRTSASMPSAVDCRLLALRASSRSAPVSDLDGGTSAVGSIAAIATPDEVRGYVYTLVDQHASTIAAWEGKVRVAEVYRNKPVRMGGRPAPLRPADKAFLERVAKSLTDHARHLHAARELLAQQEQLYEDGAPVFQPRSVADRRAAEANEAWLEECSAMSAQLQGYVVHTQATRQRVARLLDDEEAEGQWRHRAATTQHRSRSQSRRRGSRTAAAAPSQARSQSGRRASVQRADGQLTLTNGVGAGAHGSGSRRGSLGVQRIGGDSSGAITPRRTPPSHADEAGDAGGSVRGAAHLQAISPGSSHRRGSVGSQPNGGTPVRTVAPLHPDTIVRGGDVAGSPYDRTSPYGRLSPARRPSLARQDPSPPPPPPPPPRSSPALLTDGNHVGSSSDCGQPSQDQLQPVAMDEEAKARRPKAELITYRSPRGNPEAPGPRADLSDTQRQQLLLTIEYYEKNAASLRKTDLRSARDCFVELFGPQRGMRQYCNWIDELALQALRQNR